MGTATADPRSLPEAPQRGLRPDEIAAYDRDGAICARGLFPDAWVERMARAVDAAVANPSPLGSEVSKGEKGFSNDLFLWKTHDEFYSFIYESPAARIAQQVLRCERVNFFYDQLFVKPAGCHVATPWHQDITFWPIDGEQVVSIWITFDPVSRESSGLEFVRGSHRWAERFKPVDPTYNPYLLSSELPDPPDVEGHRDEFELLGWDMEPGDVLLFGGVVLHGSLGNYTTERARRALSSRWVGEGIRYAPRQPAMPLLWEHGLETGDPLGGPLFPRVLPRPIPDERARRARGPELPDPDRLKAIQAEVGAQMDRAAERLRAGS